MFVVFVDLLLGVLISHVPAASTETAGQQPLDFCGDAAVRRRDLRRPRTGELAIGSHQIFVEIPARRADLAQVVRNPAVERVRLAADDPALFGQRKVDCVIRSAELLDLVGRARLLPAKVVGRNAKHDEAAIAVALPQGFETAVLRGVPAKRGRVDDEHGPAAPGIQWQNFAIDRNELETESIFGLADVAGQDSDILKSAIVVLQLSAHAREVLGGWSASRGGQLFRAEVHSQMFVTANRAEILGQARGQNTRIGDRVVITLLCMPSVWRLTFSSPARDTRRTDRDR